MRQHLLLLLFTATMGQSQNILRGVVTDLFGVGIQDATVMITTTSKQTRVLTTGSGGVFVYSGAGDLSLTVRSRGFIEETVTIALARDMDFAVGLQVGLVTPSGGSPMSGTVFDSKGKIADNVDVFYEAALNPRLRGRTTTNRAGQFSVSFETPGLYRITAVSGQELGVKIISSDVRNSTDLRLQMQEIGPSDAVR